VWNEPNGGFWSPGDLSDATKLKTYLQLYKETSENIKKASNDKYTVGGPSLAGCNTEWVSALVELEATDGTAVDFLSCHAYGGGGNKSTSGNLDGLHGPQSTFKKYATSGGKNRTTVITEWSSSYSYNNGYHDDVASVPFIIAAAAQLQGVDITSYWTFSDVFEEGTLIPAPFHGGFGLLTIQGTPKPSYRAFQLLYGTGGVRYAVKKTKTNSNTNANANAPAPSACDTDAGVLVTSLAAGAGTRVFLYNHPKTFEAAGANCTISLNGLTDIDIDIGINTNIKLQSQSQLQSTVRHARVDDAHANPIAAWVNMGSPTYPTSAELKVLEEASELVWVNGGGFTYDVPPNGVVVVDVQSPNLLVQL
jgi:xylan 1,4-beta-xylosidase